MTRGRFVALEGIDGCGKTTQIEALREWLPKSGLMPRTAKVVASHEPGGTAFGAALRELLLHPSAHQVPGERAELLLYAADRAQHVAERIEPALAAGHWVLSDRFSGSTAAYQGFGRGLPLEGIRELQKFATGGLQPDLTLWLDVPLEESIKRRNRRAKGRIQDRIESEDKAFLKRVHTGFQMLADGAKWSRIDGTGLPANVTERCCQAILRRMGTSKDSSGLICPKCKNSEYEVRESRRFRDSIRRRRQCKFCNYYFYTVERVEDILYGARRVPFAKQAKQNTSLKDMYTAAVNCTHCKMWSEKTYDPEDADSTPCTLGFPESCDISLSAEDCPAFFPIE